MKPVISLYKKEFLSYVYSLLSYIFIVIFLVSLSWLYWQDVFLVGQVSMRDFFRLLPWFFLFFLPALSMRIWSEEKKSGTIETVLTLPISDVQAVLAKFAAATTFLACVLLFSLPIPLTLSSIGNLDWGPVIGSYVGALFLGCAYIALGQWVSSLTKNQIVAFLVSAAIAFVFMLFGMSFFTSSGGMIGTVFSTISTYTHFESLSKGVIDLRDVLYYVSFIAVFLYANVLSLGRRHRSIHTYSQPLLVIAIAVILNMLLSPINIRLDVTAGKQYTLSKASRTIVEHVEDPVTVKVFFSKKVPQDLLALRRDVEDMMKEYKRIGGKNVIIEFLDPKPQSDVENEAEKYGIPAIQFNVTSKEKFEVSSGYAGMVLLYQDTQETIPIISDTNNLEYTMTAAIQKMTRNEIPAIAFLSDHEVAKTQQVQQYLSQQFNVSSTTVDTLENVQNIVIAGPKKEFSDEEQYAIDQFVMRGGNLFVLIDGMNVSEQLGQIQPNKTGIEKILEAYGVIVNQDLVADFASPETIRMGGSGSYQVVQAYPLWPRLVSSGFNNENPISSRLQQTTIPWVSSLSLHGSDQTSVTALAKTSSQSFGFTDLTSISPEAIRTPDSNSLQEQVVAALISGTIKSAFTNREKPTSVDSSQFVSETTSARVFVVGNSRFISDDLLQQGSIENALLFVNAVDALTQDNSLISIRSRNALNRPIDPLSDTKKTVLKYGNIFSSVIIVLIIAATSFFVRKRKDLKARKMYA
ncbi:MAG TPA: Gldg family protein [Patescibacteria group bacterium]|nr:Gldg family protein [Patescibacteria group bacterium]